MIVLDASVLIAFLEGQDPHHPRAVALLEQTVDHELALSSLTLAEILVAPARTGRVDPVVNTLESLQVREIPIPPGAATRLADLRASSGLKMPDCCVLLAAEDADAGLATFDARLLRVARTRGLTVFGG